MTTDYDEEMHLKLNSLYPALASHVIEATPEDWNNFSLNMKKTDQGVSLSVVSNENKNDMVSATDEIAYAAQDITNVLQEHKSMFNEASLNVWQEDGKWKYEFENKSA